MKHTCAMEFIYWVLNKNATKLNHYSCSLFRDMNVQTCGFEVVTSKFTSIEFLSNTSLSTMFFFHVEVVVKITVFGVAFLMWFHQM